MSVVEPLPGDVYGYVAELSEAEQEILGLVRRFADERIAPIANAQWAAAEFPHELIPGFAELDVVGPARA